MTRQFLAADLKTGRILADLPPLELPDEGMLRRSLCNYDTAALTFYKDINVTIDPLQVLRHGASVVVCYDDETLPDGTSPNAIQWAGYVNAAPKDLTTDTVGISLVTLEGYFNRRYAGDGVYTAGWRSIIADLMAKYVITTDDEPGIDLLELDYSGPGEAPVTPIPYADADNAKVFARMGDLVTQFGGEFTVEWDWSDDGQFVVPRLVMGDRIGYEALNSIPPVRFEYPGTVTAASRADDYSEGNGANKVRAFSQAGTLTDPVYANFDGRPTFEARLSPQTPTDDPAVLSAYARMGAKVLGPGAQPITVSLSLADEKALRGRRLNVDWRLGDDVGYVLGGPGPDGRDTVQIFPGGLFGIARVAAYEMTRTTINPIFAESSIYGSAA